jgi:O-antigen ligase
LKINNIDFISVFFLLFCLVAPWSIAAMQILLLLIVVVSIFEAIINKRSPITWHPFFIFPAIYAISLILSSILSADIVTSLKAAFNNDWYLLILPFIASINIDDKSRKNAFILLIVSATIAGIYGIIQFFDGIEYIRNKSLNPYGNFYRSVGGYSFFLTFAGNQLLIFAVLFAYFLSDKNSKRTRIFLIVSGLIIFLSILATFGRSAWLGAGLIILLGTFIVNKKYFFYSILSLSVGILILFYISPEFKTRFISMFYVTSTNAWRVTIWGTAWNVFIHHPLFGTGHGFFQEYFHIFKVPGLYDRSGHAHNDFLNVAATTGIFGLVSWVGMWISWIYYSFKTYSKKTLIKSDRNILFGGILGLSAILFASLFQCYYTDLENNLLWWFILSAGVSIFVKENQI